MEIRRLDVDQPDELRRWYETCVASVRATRPDFVPPPLTEYVLAVTEPEAGVDRYDLVAVDGDEVLGSVMVWASTDDNLAVAWLRVDVRPDHRRRGVGRALAMAAEASLPPERSQLMGCVKYPPPASADHPYRRFAESLGYALYTTSTIGELPWPVEAAHLDALAVDPAGYRIETYVDGVPDSYRAGLGVLKGLVDVDAPSGDVEWEPAPVLPERYSEALRQLVAVGRHRVETLALTADGEVVAYTEIDVPSQPAAPLVQEGTLVRRDHRGHRLGLAVKVANLWQLLDLRAPNPSVRTCNDDANVRMSAINELLGFVAVELEACFIKHR